MSVFCNEDDYYEAISENVRYGQIKTRRPSREGFGASIDAFDDFVDASDSKLKPVRSPFGDPFSRQKVGFKDVDSKKVRKKNDECCLTDYSMFGIDNTANFDSMMADVSDTSFNDLANDDSVDQIKESATGWNDLF